MIVAGCWLGLWLSAAARLHAGPDEPEGPDTGPRVVENHRPPIDPELKKRTLSQAFVMLAGIIVGGTLLLLVVVMWGNRTRRFARSPLPQVAKRDELWFLKPKPGSSVDAPHDTTPEDEVSE